MHSKQRFKICICSVIQGELLSSPWNLKKNLKELKSFFEITTEGLQYYFPENVRCNLPNKESESFS